MHLAGRVIARGALWGRPLRATWPRILDPRHWRGGLRWSVLVPPWFAVWLALWLTIAATVVATAMLTTAMLTAPMAIVPLMSAVATIAGAGGCLTFGRCWRLAHPRNALADERLNGGHRIAVRAG